jgi:hypothetical protein
VAVYAGNGSATLGGIYSSADATVAKDGQHTVSLTAPADQNRVQAVNVPLSVVVSHTGSGTATDVHFQVALTADFAAPVRDFTLVALPDGYTTTVQTALSDQTKYYWRARAAYAGSGLWQAWTPARWFMVDTATGRGFADAHMNIGVTLTADPDSVAYVHENIGVIVAPTSFSVAYVLENVGLKFTPDPDGVAYVHEGDVSTNPPAPYIWFLLPAAGRSGDGVRIFCFGVGDLQATFAGSVELDYGSTVGWVAVPVISWQTFPPGPEAYTALRKLDPAAGYIDMQHSVIEIVIPDGALPPGYPLRIRTVTP